MDNYIRLIERIAQGSGASTEDIERKIEAKRAKLSGLISKEGAAQIVAAELGVSFDNELLKIGDLAEGMKRAHVIGKITQLFPIRSYEKNGKSGKIGSFLLGDSTSNVRVVLWDTNHIGLVESGELKEGSVVEILNGGVRNGELHLGAFSDLKPSNEVLDSVQVSRVLQEGKLVDAKAGAYVRIRGTVVQLYDPKHFDDKKDPSKKRALVNMVIDDGTETIRCVANERILESLGFSNEEIFSLEAFSSKKSDLLGDELFFVGSYKMNTYFNRLELSLERIERINHDALVASLERN